MTVKKYPVWVEDTAYTVAITNHYDEDGDLIYRRISFYLGDNVYFWNKKYEHVIRESDYDPQGYVADVKRARRGFLSYLHTYEEQYKKELEEWDGK